MFDTYPFPSLYENGNFLPDSFGGNLTFNQEVSAFLQQFHDGQHIRDLLPSDRRFYLKEVKSTRNFYPGAVNAFMKRNYLCGTNETDRWIYLNRFLLNVTIGFNTTKHDSLPFVAGYQINQRGIPSATAEELALLYNASISHGQVASMADPAKHTRTTMSIDDDGGDCEDKMSDDDDDDNVNPCEDDDDGNESANAGRATAKFANKCCGLMVGKETVTKGKAPVCVNRPRVAYDDEEDDWNDEDMTRSHWPGNEGDDDDEDDDDAKYTVDEVNNIGGGDLNARSVIASLITNQAEIESLHDVMHGVINFMNEMWTCANGILLPLPVDVVVSVPVTIYVGTFNMTTNMTDYTPMNTTMLIDTQVIVNVDLCGADGVHAENITAMVNATTQILVIGMPQNVTMAVNVSITVTVYIPDVDVLPHVDEFGQVVPDIDLINSTHLTFNMSDIYFQDFPVGVNISFPIFDPQPVGPYILAGADGSPCSTCKRLCDPLPESWAIQVLRRRTDKTLVHPMIPTEREIRILKSHLTPKGDLLCELKDQVDWIRCFVRSMMFPQVERTLFCLEMFYTDGAAPNSMAEYTKILYFLDKADAMLETIEFWYAEHGYYTQASLDYGCMNPDIVAYVQACFDFNNVTAPGKAGTCSTETLANVLAKRMGGCVIDGETSRTYSDIRTCRTFAVSNLVYTIQTMIEMIKELSGSVLSRTAWLAEFLRVAREDHPNEYIFPGNSSKCFAQPNTTLAEFVPAGDQSMASLHLYNITDTSMFNVTSVQT